MEALARKFYDLLGAKCNSCDLDLPELPFQRNLGSHPFSLETRKTNWKWIRDFNIMVKPRFNLGEQEYVIAAKDIFAFGRFGGSFEDSMLRLNPGLSEHIATANLSYKFIELLLKDTSWLIKSPIALKHELEDLRKLYRFKDIHKVGEFIRIRPYLFPPVQEAYSVIQKYFPNALLALEVVQDPDAEILSQGLVLYIETTLAVEDAMRLRDKFDEDWWIENLSRTKGDLCITLDYK